MYCGNCGKKLDEAATFCCHCGNPTTIAERMNDGNSIHRISMKLNTGSQRKEVAVMTVNTVCGWDNLLRQAPSSIAILGQLMAISSKKDYSLEQNAPLGGYKHLKYPSSARATLVQISNSGCEAFINAHANMDKIRLYTLKFQTNIKRLVPILLRGSPEERNIIAPMVFQEIAKDSRSCLGCAEQTEKEFEKLINLVNEVSLATTAAKSTNEEHNQRAIQTMDKLKRQKELFEQRKKDLQAENEAINEQLAKSKAELDVANKNLPGPGQLVAATTFEKVLNVATTGFGIAALSTLAAPVGFACAFAYGATEIVKACQSAKPEDDNKTKNSDKEAFTTAFQNAPEINCLISMISKIIVEDPCGSHVNQKLSETGTELDKIKELLESSNNCSHPAVKWSICICKRGKEMCEQVQSFLPGPLTNLVPQMEDVKKDAENLKIKAENFIFSGSIANLNVKHGSSQLQTGMAQQITENALMKIEIKRHELECIQKEKKEGKKRMQEIEEKNMLLLENLSDTNINNINFEAIIDTLSEGINSLSELKESWVMLVLLFNKITNRINISFSQISGYERTITTENCSIIMGSRDFILEMAGTINAVAYALGLVAEAYTDISEKYLVQNTAGLAQMIALDPDKDAEKLAQKRANLNKNCKEAHDHIRRLADEFSMKTTKNIDEQFEKLEIIESELPDVVAEERRRDIKKTVANCDKMDFFTEERDSGDYI